MKVNKIMAWMSGNIITIPDNIVWQETWLVLPEIQGGYFSFVSRKKDTLYFQLKGKKLIQDGGKLVLQVTEARDLFLNKYHPYNIYSWWFSISIKSEWYLRHKGY